MLELNDAKKLAEIIYAHHPQYAVSTTVARNLMSEVDKRVEFDDAVGAVHKFYARQSARVCVAADINQLLSSVIQSRRLSEYQLCEEMAKYSHGYDVQYRKYRLGGHSLEDTRWFIQGLVLKHGDRDKSCV